jgi:hypothetical protein
LPSWILLNKSICCVVVNGTLAHNSAVVWTPRKLCHFGQLNLESHNSFPPACASAVV